MRLPASWAPSSGRIEPPRRDGLAYAPQMPKPHLEFFSTSHLEWTTVGGNDSGLSEAVLAKDKVTDVATRLLRFAPGTDTTPLGPQIHDFSEEVYILEGDLRDLTLEQTFSAGMYACRPPGARHGPWRSETGCLALEVRYP